MLPVVNPGLWKYDGEQNTGGGDQLTRQSGWPGRRQGVRWAAIDIGGIGQSLEELSQSPSNFGVYKTCLGSISGKITGQFFNEPLARPQIMKIRGAGVPARRQSAKWCVKHTR
jgi:hypothetical protein